MSIASESAPLDLDAIQARADAATGGQWGWRPFGSDPENAIRIVSYPPGIEHWEVIADEIWIDADAEFIAAARTDVPLLVAALLEVRELHMPRRFDYQVGSWVPGDARPDRTLCGKCTGRNWPCETYLAAGGVA